MSNTCLGSWLPELTFWCSSSFGSFATGQPSIAACRLARRKFPALIPGAEWRHFLKLRQEHFLRRAKGVEGLTSAQAWPGPRCLQLMDPGPLESPKRHILTFSSPVNSRLQCATTGSILAASTAFAEKAAGQLIADCQSLVTAKRGLAFSAVSSLPGFEGHQRLVLQHLSRQARTGF